MRVKEFLQNIYYARRIRREKELHSLLGYSIVIFFGFLMIGVNLFSFLVCFSNQYPVLAQTLHIQKEEEIELNSAQVYTYVCGMNSMGGCDSERVNYDNRKIIETFSK